MLRALSLAGILLIAPHAFAHHSFGAEYDSAKPVTLTGVVTKIDWSNPHVYIYLDVKGDNGQIDELGAGRSSTEYFTPHRLDARRAQGERCHHGYRLDVEGWQQSDRWTRK